MKRVTALHRWSREHHTALTLAQRIIRLGGDIGATDAAEFAGRFERELAPHFAGEEAHLLPALAAAGEIARVARTHAEHAQLRDLAREISARAGHHQAAALAFARLLKAHVHFEERELFPTAEARLPAAIMHRIEQHLDTPPEVSHGPRPAPAPVA